MQRIPLHISDTELKGLNERFPPSSKSSDVGKRAVELSKFYFRSLDTQCLFRERVGDCDLEVTKSTGEVLRIEIKGTASLDIAWDRLKVSGNPSHDALLNGMPIHRVTGVYEQNPVIFVLIHPDDFRMETEPRWSVRKCAP